MSINNSITNNPNVRMFILKSIAKKFKGYIAGLGGSNSIFDHTSDPDSLALLDKIKSLSNQVSQSTTQSDAAKELTDTILDTAQGAFRTSDYMYSSKIYDRSAERRV